VGWGEQKWLIGPEVELSHNKKYNPIFVKANNHAKYYSKEEIEGCVVFLLPWRCA
jgi:hypothetical protein